MYLNCIGRADKMRQKILTELWLKKGEIVSGNELAQRLNMSRVAIWKHIENLKKDGYDIMGIKGKGYKLRNHLNIVIPDIITDHLDNRLLGREIKFYNRVDSTNEVIKRGIMEKGFQEGTVVIALTQNKGKGRLRRSWESPQGGLWFSFILKPNLPLEKVALLSLVFAVAIAKGIESYTDKEINLKWPNDILIENRKMAGILLELSGELDGTENVIAGCGINVNNQSAAFPPELQNSIISLSEACAEPIDSSELLMKILPSIEKYYHKYISSGFEDILREFKSHCNHLGEKIQVNLGNKIITGINTAIDMNGNLIIDTGEEEIKLSTGDVRVL